MKYNLILLFCITLWFGSCRKETPTTTPPALNCGSITSSLIGLDTESLKLNLNPALANFTMMDLDNNACVHELKFQAFEDLINENCPDLTTEVLCCGCIFTSPPQSHFSISFESNDTTVVRILDISTPEEGPLSIVGVHE